MGGDSNTAIRIVKQSPNLRVHPILGPARRGLDVQTHRQLGHRRQGVHDIDGKGSPTRFDNLRYKTGQCCSKSHIGTALCCRDVWEKSC
jgi:hypothetical protein